MTTSAARSRMEGRVVAATLVTGRVRTGSVPPAMPVESADEFRLNLTDLPRGSIGLDVDGFRISLLSRLLDCIDRLRGR